jgi:hypothetical protein
LRTSGAVYPEVPQTVYAKFPSFKNLDTPKSAILIEFKF